MNKSSIFLYLTICAIFLFQLISADIYSDCTIYGNCKPATSTSSGNNTYYQNITQIFNSINSTNNITIYNNSEIIIYNNTVTNITYYIYNNTYFPTCTGSDVLTFNGTDLLCVAGGGGDGSTYNSTYNLWAYNQTEGANEYTNSVNQSTASWINSIFLKIADMFTKNQITDMINGNVSESVDNLRYEFLNNNLTINGSRWNYSTPDTTMTFNGYNSLLGSPTNPSGGINFIQTRPEAKDGIWWTAYDKNSDTIRAVAWIVAHYNSSTGNGVHSHIGIETLDNETGIPSMNTKLEISYGSNNTQQNGGSYVKINSADFIVGGLDRNQAFFDSNNKIKFNPYGTFEVYPNNQETIALRITNDSSGIVLQTLGGSYTTFQDNINVSSGLDVCITGGNCLSKTNTYNSTYNLWAYNQTIPAIEVSKNYTDTKLSAYYNKTDYSSNGLGWIEQQRVVTTTLTTKEVKTVSYV